MKTINHLLLSCFLGLFFFLLPHTVLATSSDHHQEHHSSISDLLAPTFNFFLFVLIFIFFAMPKIRRYFQEQNEQLHAMYHGGQKEDQRLMQEIKAIEESMSSLNAQGSKIRSSIDKDYQLFEQQQNQGLSTRLKELKRDADLQLEHEKKQSWQNFLNEWLFGLKGQVIKKIDTDKSLEKQSNHYLLNKIKELQ